jgi:DNA-binding MarR family transcriptional regulator
MRSLTTDERAPPIDRETAAALRPADHKAELRLWLRMLTCTTLIESGVRRKLRDGFDVTLPRFDLMAQLDKTPDGLTLGELSRRMMVSNGNVTAIVEALLAQGLIDRKPSAEDRRAQRVSLTAAGRTAFHAMAAAHADWIGDAFAGLTMAEADQLMLLLGRAKMSARRTFIEELA